jgi:hypothetical protein
MHSSTVLQQVVMLTGNFQKDAAKQVCTKAGTFAKSRFYQEKLETSVVKPDPDTGSEKN